MEKKQTAMQELRSDLIATLESSKDTLDDIIDQDTRSNCQLVVELTLQSIIKRIDNELLQWEKEQIMNSWVKGVVSEDDMTAEKYYGETYKN